MLKNCDAPCDATHLVRTIQRTPHLWLRNNVFYIRMESDRVNGKRRYTRISLHTNNFYEARAMIMQQNEIQAQLAKLRQLYRQLIIQEFHQSTPPDCYGFKVAIPVIRKISTRNKPSLLTHIWNCYNNLKNLINNPNSGLSDKDKSIINFIKENENVFYEMGIAFGRGFAQGKAEVQNQPQAQIQAQSMVQMQSPSFQTRQTNELFFTIGDMISKMLMHKNNTAAVQTRKEHNLQKLISEVNLTLLNNYQDLHNLRMVEQISKNIKAQKETKGDNKRVYIRHLTELLKFANSIAPDQFPLNVLSIIPNIEKTKKSDKNPHLSYNADQLLKIFDPDNTIFKKDPDFFWICMVALFTGARQNAAFTLQYDDICQKEGIDCIWFRENHAIKHLKNEASERIVPIHSQLKELGFIDYVKRKQNKQKAKGSDFIFSNCITTGNQYNNKYIVRMLAPLLNQLGIKSGSHDGYDFHSFRKTLNVALINAGVKAPYINRLIGWESKSMSEGTYFIVNLSDILNEFEKFKFDFLTSYFATWKTIMAKKP